MISRRAKITRTGAATGWFQGEDRHARRCVSFDVVANTHGIAEHGSLFLVDVDATAALY